jgi:hypothetical protein
MSWDDPKKLALIWEFLGYMGELVALTETVPTSQQVITASHLTLGFIYCLAFGWSHS